MITLIMEPNKKTVQARNVNSWFLNEEDKKKIANEFIQNNTKYVKNTSYQEVYSLLKELLRTSGIMDDKVVILKERRNLYLSTIVDRYYSIIMKGKKASDKWDNYFHACDCEYVDERDVLSREEHRSMKYYERFKNNFWKFVEEKGIKPASQNTWKKYSNYFYFLELFVNYSSIITSRSVETIIFAKPSAVDLNVRFLNRQIQPVVKKIDNKFTVVRLFHIEIGSKHKYTIVSTYKGKITNNSRRADVKVNYVGYTNNDISLHDKSARGIENYLKKNTTSLMENSELAENNDGINLIPFFRKVYEDTRDFYAGMALSLYNSESGFWKAYYGKDYTREKRENTDFTRLGIYVLPDNCKAISIMKDKCCGCVKGRCFDYAEEEYFDKFIKSNIDKLLTTKSVLKTVKVKDISNDKRFTGKVLPFVSGQNFKYSSAFDFDNGFEEAYMKVPDPDSESTISNIDLIDEYNDDPDIVHKRFSNYLPYLNVFLKSTKTYRVEFSTIFNDNVVSVDVHTSILKVNDKEFSLVSVYSASGKLLKSYFTNGKYDTLKKVRTVIQREPELLSQYKVGAYFLSKPWESGNETDFRYIYEKIFNETHNALAGHVLSLLYTEYGFESSGYVHTDFFSEVKKLQKMGITVPLGRNALNEWMREDSYLIKNHNSTVECFLNSAYLTNVEI